MILKLCLIQSPIIDDDYPLKTSQTQLNTSITTCASVLTSGFECRTGLNKQRSVMHFSSFTQEFIIPPPRQPSGIVLASSAIGPGFNPQSVTNVTTQNRQKSNAKKKTQTKIFHYDLLLVYELDEQRVFNLSCPLIWLSNSNMCQHYSVLGVNA